MAYKSRKRSGGKQRGSRGPRPGTGGRPRKGKEAQTQRHKAPWKKLGISQRTWYRRRALRKAKK